ncbi:probable palmitoyltransferase ZDHHC11B [Daphnia pulicaria]|uniref:probable palmitoyltransferase ZDHHC11B n=1 Tax=Daphnia pulicaria TaxID=35523 RepID=UPI001EE9FEB5|nr:probable palmitoyltransferase ZDHHC11B [Daphnia pulicaria]
MFKTCDMKRKNKVKPQETPDWKRKHGFQLPLHPQQIIGWSLLFFAAFFVHTIQIPSLPFNFRIPLQLVIAVILTILVCSMLVTSLCNCEDLGCQTVKDNAVKCQWCDVILSSPQTKHCSLCNKCIEGFDHHCKWLNQCIGSRNYFHFVISITSACILCVTICLLSVAEISLLYTCRRSFTCIKPLFLDTALDPVLFTVLSSVFFLLSAFGSGLLIHLCVFHAYIKWNGWTTYEYIRRQLDNELNSYPPNYLVKKTKKRWWSQCPCFACYTACQNKSHREQTNSPIYTISSAVTGVSSLLLHHTLNNVVSIHPSLSSTVLTTDNKVGSLGNSNKLWKQTPNLPKIIRTSPSVDASGELWTSLNARELPNPTGHLLKPA